MIKRTTETVNLIRNWANRAGKTQFHAQNDNTNTLLAFGLKTDHNDGMQNEDEQIKLSFYHYQRQRLSILVFLRIVTIIFYLFLFSKYLSFLNLWFKTYHALSFYMSNDMSQPITKLFHSRDKYVIFVTDQSQNYFGVRHLMYRRNSTISSTS